MKETDELETPPWLVQELNRIFRFTWDAASSPKNCLFGANADCLKVNWIDYANGGVVYLNPPYSDPEPFLSQAVKYKPLGITTIALLKGDPSTKWWNRTVKNEATLIWLPKRIKFYLNGEPTEYAASFPSVLAIYLGIQL